MNKIAILFSGKGSNFAHIVNALHHKELEVVVALTNNPDAEGITIAKEHQISLWRSSIPSLIQAEKPLMKLLLKNFSTTHLTLQFLAGFMRILTPVFTR